MSDRVVVRDAPRERLTVWHDRGDDGRPVCRQGVKPDCSYRVTTRECLPEGVTHCAYCSGEYTPTSELRPDTLASKLANTDPEEVLGQ